MSLIFAIAIYFVIWWLVLFTTLPIGVRTQDETGQVEPGTPGSAPAAPRLLFKFILTTLIASVVFALLYSAIEYKWFTLDDIPFLPRFDSVG